jgi:hypothetical protein
VHAPMREVPHVLDRRPVSCICRSATESFSDRVEPRIRSILRKAQDQGSAPGAIIVSHSDERAVILALDGFDAALQTAYDRRAPHFLAEHAFLLAQAFAARDWHPPAQRCGNSCLLSSC